MNINEEDKALLLFILFVDSYDNFLEMILCEKDTITVRRSMNALL